MDPTLWGSLSREIVHHRGACWLCGEEESVRAAHVPLCLPLSSCVTVTLETHTHVQHMSPCTTGMTAHRLQSKRSGWLHSSLCVCFFHCTSTTKPNRRSGRALRTETVLTFHIMCVVAFDIFNLCWRTQSLVFSHNPGVTVNTGTQINLTMGYYGELSPIIAVKCHGACKQWWCCIIM